MAAHSSPGPLPRLTVAASLVAVGLLVFGACSSSGPVDTTEFCNALRKASAVNGSIASLDIDDPATLEGAIADLAAVAELAPAEIREDAATVADTYGVVLNSLASTAPGARGDVLRDLQPTLDDVAAPASALQRYGETTCNIGFDAPAAPTPTPTPLDIDD